MTYPNDPNRSDLDRGLDPAGRRINESWGTGPIILASLAALAIVFSLFFMMSDRNPTVASNVNRPAVTTTTTAPAPVRETTGSGAVNRTPDSTGTTPAITGQAPAPTSPPAANR
jgi:hypothetical protein